MNNPYSYLKDYIGKPMSYTKEFCPLLGLEKKRGKAKELQLKKIGEYLELSNENRKITIKSIYNDTETHVLQTKRKYLPYIEDFFLLYLHKKINEGYSSMVLTNRNILELTSMVNPDYFKGMYRIYDYIDCFELPINDVDLPPNKDNYIATQIRNESHIFFSASYRLLKRLINDCLNTLEEKSLLYKMPTYVCYKNIKNEFGWHSETYICDESMISRIVSVQYTSMYLYNLIMDARNTPEYKIQEKNQQYYLSQKNRQLLNDLLHDLFVLEFIEEGFTSFSSAWNLILSEKGCFELEIHNRNFDVDQLNNNVISKLQSAKCLQGIVLKDDFIDMFIKKDRVHLNNTLAKIAKPYISEK